MNIKTNILIMFLFLVCFTTFIILLFNMLILLVLKSERQKIIQSKISAYYTVIFIFYFTIFHNSFLFSSVLFSNALENFLQLTISFLLAMTAIFINIKCTQKHIEKFDADKLKNSQTKT